MGAATGNRARGPVGCGASRPLIAASICAAGRRSSSTVYRYHGVNRVSVISSWASGSPRYWRTTSAVPRACIRPMVIPRPRDGFVHPHGDDPGRDQRAVATLKALPER